MLKRRGKKICIELEVEVLINILMSNDVHQMHIVKALKDATEVFNAFSPMEDEEEFEDVKVNPRSKYTTH